MNNTSAENAAIRRSLCSMSIRLVWPFVQLKPLQQQPLFERWLQAKLGVHEQAFHNPNTRVSTQRVLCLLDRALDRLDQPAIGLLAAQHVTTEHIGVVEHLARTSASLGDALRACDRYLRLLCDGARQSLDVSGDRACARFWLDSELLASAAAEEFALAVRLNMVRRISGKKALTPLEVHFRHPRPRDLRLHHQTFDCALRFGEPATQLILPAEIMELPPTSAEPALNRLLESQADTMLRDLPCLDDLVGYVRKVLISEIHVRDAKMSRLAARLGISVRTLSRRLADEGTSFRELIDERRKTYALCDLARTLRPIDDIARHLGYSTNQSFHRAFRRWTGETAARFRDRSHRRDLMHRAHARLARRVSL